MRGTSRAGTACTRSAGRCTLCPFDLKGLTTRGSAVPVIVGVRRGIWRRRTEQPSSRRQPTGTMVYLTRSGGVVVRGAWPGAERWWKRPSAAQASVQASMAHPRVSPNGRLLAVKSQLRARRRRSGPTSLSGEAVIQRLTFGGQNRFPSLVGRQPSSHVPVDARSRDLVAGDCWWPYRAADQSGRGRGTYPGVVVAGRHSSAVSRSAKPPRYTSVVADGEGRPQSNAFGDVSVDGSAQGGLLTRRPLGGIRVSSHRPAAARCRRIAVIFVEPFPSSRRETSSTKDVAGLPSAVVSGRQHASSMFQAPAGARVGAGDALGLPLGFGATVETAACTDSGAAVGGLSVDGICCRMDASSACLRASSTLRRLLGGPRPRDPRHPQLVRRTETPGAARSKESGIGNQDSGRYTSAIVSGRGLLPSTSVKP